MRILWALFGNDEDGPYGCGTKWNPSCEQTRWRAARWWFRNPCHNFTHHVVGIYGRAFVSKEIIAKVDGKGYSKSVRILGDRRYPYWHYAGRGWQAYLGWRDSGAFGISLRERTNG